MAGARDLSEAEIPLLSQSFGGRYAHRDRCYFHMSLQTGLRVSEMLSLTVGQVYQYGKVASEIAIERRYLKGGKSGKASGRTLPLFEETHPYILRWLQDLARMLKVPEAKDIPASTPLFMSRVRAKDGTRRAIARETAWRILKGVARDNELAGPVSCHSTRKTLARRAQQHFHGDVLKVQRILGHRSLQSTMHYLKSLSDAEVWAEFRQAPAA